MSCILYNAAFSLFVSFSPAISAASGHRFTILPIGDQNFMIESSRKNMNAWEFGASYLRMKEKEPPAKKVKKIIYISCVFISPILILFQGL